MLNDYRIFEYRIKCSFSFSFVRRSRQTSLSDSVVCSFQPLWHHASASRPTPRTSNATAAHIDARLDRRHHTRH